MSTLQIFGLQVILSFAVYGLIARWYVPPALAALVALRGRSAVALPLVWLFTVVGLLDLINAFYQGLAANVQLGAAYYIPTFVVPALVITHAMIFRMLVRPRR